MKNPAKHGMVSVSIIRDTLKQVDRDLSGMCPEWLVPEFLESALAQRGFQAETRPPGKERSGSFLPSPGLGYRVADRYLVPESGQGDRTGSCRGKAVCCGMQWRICRSSGCHRLP